MAGEGNKASCVLTMVEAGWVSGGSSYYPVFFCACLKIGIRFSKREDEKELPLPLPLVTVASGEHMLPGVNAAIL